jgi:CheY-like chemotaxis protein
VSVTARARDVDRARALDAGFDRHLAKPVDARWLAQAVAALAGV